MIAGTISVELLVGAEVCDCPGGPARWSLSQGRDAKYEFYRRAACLGCGRAWEKRVVLDREPTEDDWRAIPAVEVH